MGYSMNLSMDSMKKKEKRERPYAWSSFFVFFCFFVFLFFCFLLVIPESEVYDPVSTHSLSPKVEDRNTSAPSPQHRSQEYTVSYPP